MRIGLLGRGDHTMPVIPDRSGPDDMAVEYAEDRLLADLLPAIAREAPLNDARKTVDWDTTQRILRDLIEAHSRS